MLSAKFECECECKVAEEQVSRVEGEGGIERSVLAYLRGGGFERGEVINRRGWGLVEGSVSGEQREERWNCAR